MRHIHRLDTDGKTRVAGRTLSFVSIMLGALVVCLEVTAADVDVTKLPPAVSTKIDFSRDIQPILEKSCLRCHGAERPKGRYRLDSREAALKGGENGVDIVPGNSVGSPLIHYVAYLVEDMEMPPPGKGDRLTAEQVGLLRAWIDQGVPWIAAGGKPQTQITVIPTLGFIGLDGNQQAFREQFWIREGWNAGAELFEIRERTAANTEVTLSGHALRDSYRVSLRLDRQDVGFIGAGAGRFRRYYSDSGGYFPLFSPSIFSLNRNLFVDNGRAWVEAGLRIPDWPKLTVGYEFQTRDGSRSSLHWGPVTQGLETTGAPRSRRIYPASKELEEQTHIIRLDLDHEVAGFRIEDNFHAEFYDLRNNRTSLAVPDPTLPPANFEFTQERHHHFHGANAIRLEKEVTDWLFTSGGYLYSSLQGDASAFRELSAAPFPSEIDRTHFVTLRREAHVFNGNVLFGPWAGLTLTGGVQPEWTREEGFGEGVFQTFLTGTRSTIDRFAIQEDVGLRYRSIPFTVLFADARLRQESLGHAEQQLSAGSPYAFVRDTDETADMRDFRVGFTTSPWRRMSLTAHYRKNIRDTEYDHLLDIMPPPNFQGTNFGYPAFITSREMDSDEIDLKLALHLPRGPKTTLGFKTVHTDYDSATDSLPGLNPITFELVPGFNSPGGFLRAGQYDAQIYSLNFTFPPWRRISFSTTFSLENSETTTEHHDVGSVVPYEGYVFSALASMNFAWTEKTDLRASYSFSHADYSQENFTRGLPVGMEYQRHWFQVGIGRRLLENLRAGLQYALFLYDEPSNGHFNDYTAHAVFATLTLRFP